MTRFNDLLVLAIVLATTTTLFAQDAVQWRVEDGGNGHWYEVLSTPLTWWDAEAAALAAGGHLATIHSEEENQIIVDVRDLVGQGGCWIGLRQDPDGIEPGGGWGWVTGEPFDYTKWRFNEPDDSGSSNQTSDYDYVEICCHSTEWADWSGGSPIGSYAIEWSADCNGDGIVDYGQILDGTFSDTNANGVPDCCDDATCLGPVQWTEAEGGNGHWYQAIPIQINWNSARSTALALGGDLASLEEDGELSALITLLLDPNQEFLFATQGWGPHVGGLEDPDSGEFRWLTGELIDCFNLTCENESAHQTRVQLSTYNDDVGYGYNDVDGDEAPSASQPGYLIEWSADCNGDGIVDYGQILDGTLADDNGDGVPDVCIAVQWRIEDGGNGHWYQEVLEPGISWGNASDSCISIGGHLATVTSAEENLFIAGISNVNKQVDYGIWLGGFQDKTLPDFREPGGGWTWVTNEPWSYESWNQNDCHPSNQPDNANQGESVLDYFCGTGDALYWSDDGPEWPGSGGYLIEWSADCNGDGIVDYEQVLDGTFTDCNGNLVPDVCEISETFAGSVDRTPESIADFIEFDVSAMADANDTVTLDISAVGDLAVSGEFLWVYLDDTLLDLVFVDDGAACEEVSTTLSILATEWNDAGADGSRLVKISGTNIDPDACSEPFVGISVIVPIPFADCDDSGTWDACDIAGGLASDLDGNGVPDSCDPDCDGDGEPDAYEISSGQELDCNANEIPDNCDIGDGGSSSDVDSNGVPDDCQPDCDGDGVPDSWELSEGLAMDCNTNGYPDNCDILEGTSNDIDSNGVPDECKDDCNGNGIPDYWEIKQGDVADCDDNGIPDPCDIAAGNLPDCDNDLISDDCAIADGVVSDCNDNGIPDSCDIADGFNEDENKNGIPDACELAAGDLNLDGCIDGADLAILLGLWGFPNPPIGDLNGDGIISGADLAGLLGSWRPCGG